MFLLSTAILFIDYSDIQISIFQGCWEWGLLTILLLTSWTLTSDSVSGDDIKGAADDVKEAAEDIKGAEVSDVEDDVQNVTRSRRQTVKTLPRLPRQIFRHNSDLSDIQEYKQLVYKYVGRAES